MAGGRIIRISYPILTYSGISVWFFGVLILLP